MPSAKRSARRRATRNAHIENTSPGARRYQSHGSGRFLKRDFRQLGSPVIFEDDIRVFHPENITIGNNVYIGHGTFLKGYYRNEIVIGDDTWIGQACFLHGAGGITIGRAVGIGPMVKILTSVHDGGPREMPIVFQPIRFAPVLIEDGVDIGVGTIILPGVSIGRGAQIGAGAVVSRNVPPYAVAAGVPARVLRYRP